MAKKRYRMGVLTKTFLMFGAGVCGAVVVLSATLFFYMRDTTDLAVQELINSTTSSNARQLNSLIDRIRVAAETLGSNETGYVLPNDNIPAIKQMILFGEPGEGNCDLYPLMTDFSVNRTTFNNSFNSCFGRETGRYTNKLYILPEYTISRYCNKSQQLTDDGCGFFSAVSVQQSEWFQETVRRDGSEYWFTLPDTPNTLYMTRLSVCNILGGNMELQRKHLGVLALSFDVSWVSSRIQTGALTQGSRVLIADMDGNGLFVSSGGEYLPREQVLALPENEVVPLTAFGEECRVQKEVLNNQLMMLTVIPLSELRARTNDVLRVIVIAAAAVLAVTQIAAFFLARRVVTPIRRLSSHMSNSGMKQIDCSRVGNDEVGTLYHAFNHLMQRLRESTRRAIDASERQKRAELHALQAQINPHFVYNTLNSVSCLALLRGQDDIAEVLNSLTQLMRYNIKEPDKCVTVAEEVRILHAYERIQRCCYRDTVAFEYDVSPEAEPICIPKVIIQPLMENAVIHGADFRDGGALIRLRVRVAGEHLAITVWDNGVGADVDAINGLLNSPESVTREKSIGLRNVYTRLHMIYGSRGVLEFRQDSGGHTEACITVPIVR